MKIFKLKESVDLSQFLTVAEKCSGDIFFHTAKGDILNVKSMFSRCVAVSVHNPGELQRARVICTNENDYRILDEYLLPDAEA